MGGIFVAGFAGLILGYGFMYSFRAALERLSSKRRAFSAFLGLLSICRLAVLGSAVFVLLKFFSLDWRGLLGGILLGQFLFRLELILRVLKAEEKAIWNV